MTYELETPTLSLIGFGDVLCLPLLGRLRRLIGSLQRLDEGFVAPLFLHAEELLELTQRRLRDRTPAAEVALKTSYLCIIAIIIFTIIIILITLYYYYYYYNC